MLQSLRNIWDIPDLRKRVLFTLGLLAVYRLGNHIPTPGINAKALIDFFEQNKANWFGLVDMFSGGNLAKVTIFALGIMPYISSSIILQLLTVVWPYLEKLSKEGELGRRKITQYTRYGTVLLSIVQSLGIAVYLERMTLNQSFRIVEHPGFAFKLMTVMTLTTGTAFIMWLGEQITERGIGNGMSLLIFAGIVVGFPRGMLSTLEMIRRGDLSLLATVFLLAMMVLVVAAIVFVERGPARITVQYAKRVVGPAHVRRPVHPPAAAREHQRRHPRDLRVLHHRLPPDHRLLLPGQQPLDAVGLRAAEVGDAALQPALRLLHHLLLLLLHGHRLQPDDVAENMRKYGGFVPGHPSGQAHRRVPGPHPGPHHLRRRHLPGPHRAAPRVPHGGLQGGAHPADRSPARRLPLENNLGWITRACTSTSTSAGPRCSSSWAWPWTRWPRWRRS
jgi:preprotein translocase subunit SecY